MGIFLTIIVLGLILGVVVFLKEQRAEGAASEPVGRAPIQKSSLKLPAMSVALQNSGVVLPAVTIENDGRAAAILALEQKVRKLEELLVEKNQALAQLEADLKNQQSRSKEFDVLRGILQRQIDELKSQNKGLKDEVARASQDPVRLQAESLMGTPPLVVHAAPDVSSVSLKDIFDDTTRHKEGNDAA